MLQCNSHRRAAAGQAKPKLLTCCSHGTRTGWGREAAGGGARRLSRSGHRRTVREGVERVDSYHGPEGTGQLGDLGLIAQF